MLNRSNICEWYCMNACMLQVIEQRTKCRGMKRAMRVWFKFWLSSLIVCLFELKLAAFLGTINVSNELQRLQVYRIVYI